MTLTVGVVEVAGRIILKRRGGLYVIDGVDHRMMPGSASDLNSDGIRSSREATEFEEPGHNIIFLGDSYVYGFRLESSQSLPSVLEQMARRELRRDDIRVANFGWISSSPLLSLRLLRDIGRKYRPHVVLLAVDMTDFADEVKYRLLLQRQGVYRMLDVTPISFLALRRLTSLVSPSLSEYIFGFPVRRFFMTDGPLAGSRRYLVHLQQSIDLLYNCVTTEFGAKFVVFVLPRTYQYSTRESPRNWEAGEYELRGPYAEEPFKYFDEVRKAAPYPVYSLLEDFKATAVFPTAFEDDPHWNTAGTQVAAEAVFRYCREAGCFGGARD